MNAEKETIVNKNRKNLWEVVPLKAPYSVSIDVSSVCNFKCKFCAVQSSEKKVSFKKQFMEFDLFKKIVDDLAEFQVPLKMCRLALDGEPLLNKRLPEMIEYAKIWGFQNLLRLLQMEVY